MPKGKRPVELTKGAESSLAWVDNLENRKLFAGKKSGIILYRLPAEYKGQLCKKLGIVPVYDTSTGLIRKWRLVSSGGRKFRTWSLVTLEYDLALKLADAIYSMLGVTGVQDTRQTERPAPDKLDKPGTLSEEDETEMLLKKFRGA